MLGFMDYIQREWGFSTGWNRDNSYGALTATSKALLDFQTPLGLSLSLSSLSSPKFANSYTLANAGVVDGSVSYLYTSLPLSVASRSSSLSLKNTIEGYRHLQELGTPDESSTWEVWHSGRRIDTKNTLLYGRLYLPQSLLEGLYLRRISPTAQVRISCVSSSALRNGGSILLLLSRDSGKYSTEYLYSTDSGLLGVRGLYNFGPPPEPRNSTLLSAFSGDSELPAAVANGRFSAGAELYYGVLNKSGGMSMGCRFTTLSTHTGFPYTMTLTVNPLMGNLSSTYSVKAGSLLALATRFDFNVYSYESQYQVGFELWKRSRDAEDLQWALDKIKSSELNGWAADNIGQKAHATTTGVQIPHIGTVKSSLAGKTINGEETAGVLKAKLNQDGVFGLLWEGRLKQLLYTFGMNMHLKERENIFRGVGIEFQYSS